MEPNIERPEEETVEPFESETPVDTELAKRMQKVAEYEEKQAEKIEEKLSTEKLKEELDKLENKN